MDAITVEHITKKYGGVLALNDVSFTVGKGELFGLIGPDGAGKSTLFRILTTLLLADKGKGTVAGHPIVNEYKEIRKKVGYMPGRFSLYQDLSIEENLSFFATIFGTTVEDNYDLIKDIYVQIEPFKKRLAGKLSGGMKQKLALCCALIHKPEVLFLDEPTTGVDAVSRVEFWDMLKKLKTKGIAILVSTPYMDEATLCDRIALIQNGEILKINSPQQMISNFEKPLFSINSTETYRLLNYLRVQNFTESVLPFGENLHLITNKPYEVSQIEHHLKISGFSDSTAKTIQPTVEDIFLDVSQPVN
ncbi:ABC transporter ATP-binding protein [Flavivirga aquimarina]|uniref:ABC transporter ATP-binding protein n=1 Tax=Flavivirga aquimarina TaxID=2027862 RepID=A0ABT8WAJ3_9FLAO|nr:ABC transporter ATP-binding protein [Flavivirga aquimarina]MDO5970139.1 ABC transporter ATP-binding protein [Flavivirga aquimarina]